jgi:hypothetical protein
LSSGVLSEPRRKYLAHDHFIDLRGIQTGTLNGTTDYDCTKFDSRDVCQ